MFYFVAPLAAIELLLIMFTAGHAEDPDEEAFNAAVENSDAYHPGASEYPDEDEGNVTPRAGSPEAGFYYPPPSSMPSFSSGSGSQYPMNAFPPPERDPDEAIQGDDRDSYDDRRATESARVED